MANTKKDPEQRKTMHLRIPLTPSQHAKIKELHGETGMADWAREILLNAIASESEPTAVSKSKRKTA